MIIALYWERFVIFVHFYKKTYPILDLSFRTLWAGCNRMIYLAFFPDCKKRPAGMHIVSCGAC